MDELPIKNRNEQLIHLQAKFQKYYISTGNKFNSAYPDVFPRCFFVSCHDGTHIAQLRDEIYELALSIKTGTALVFVCVCFYDISLASDRHHKRKKGGETLLRQPIPVCYIILQEIVREKARECIQNKAPPILTTKEFR